MRVAQARHTSCKALPVHPTVIPLKIGVGASGVVCQTVRFLGFGGGGGREPGRNPIMLGDEVPTEFCT